MKKEKKGMFAAINAEQSTLFISFSEAIFKLAEDTEDSFSDIARTLLRIGANEPTFAWDKEREEFSETSWENIHELLNFAVTNNAVGVLETEYITIDPDCEGWMRQSFLRMLRMNLRGYTPPATLKEPSNGSELPQQGRVGRSVATRPRYLDAAHPRFSAKLAAAVLTWEAMEDETLRRGKMPMAAMKAWLEKHYEALNLAHKRGSKVHGYDAGDMNKTAIDEVAKICNWEVDGGPPPTPGG